MSNLVPPPPPEGGDDKPQTEEEDINREYKVERILFHYDFRLKNKKDKLRLFLTKWDSYPTSDCTWEAAETLDEEMVHDYSVVYGVHKFELDDELDVELESELYRPKVPHLQPEEVVSARKRTNEITGVEEMMYLTSYELVPFKMWITKDDENIQELIGDYEKKATGKKRGRSGYEEDSADEFEDESELYNPPPEKRQKTEEGMKKKRRNKKTPEKEKVSPKKKKKKSPPKDKKRKKEKKKKKKKKKKSTRKYNINNVKYKKKDESITVKGTRKKNGKKVEIEWSLHKLKRNDIDTAYHCLEEAFLAVAGEGEIDLDIDLV